MFIEINPGGSLPVYEQVVEQLKFSIATGAVRSGEMILSVREMARRLAINPNTVARAYAILQAEGVVYASRGTGLIVAEGAQEYCRRERHEIFERRFGQLIEEAVASRLDEGVVRDMIQYQLDRCFARDPGEGGNDA